ncbi:hypothetical protein [Streptomyces roseochromogenus]|uniref:Uncharacterized protein n=1 Tax=Streptomyces roseochromogenus subsp. oscitans DS 12.976 TaxID=1352936 RepID=V6JNV3_STRRC|nr:hypothetical protein [Streptomyces roseochromogenus]EST18514.1 hypothetical protein M878_45170 [Streptomyces roseochromogenus subsp. oscitans DS 12.976]
MLDPDASKIWHAITIRGGTVGLADEIAIPTGQNPQAVHGQIVAFVDALVATGVLFSARLPHRGEPYKPLPAPACTVTEHDCAEEGCLL